jgi:glutamyl endopeptidase
MADGLLRSALGALGKAHAGLESAAPAGPPTAQSAQMLYERSRELIDINGSWLDHDPERRRLITDHLEAGRKALHQVVSSGTLAGLDTRQLNGLEAIVRLTGRPSFLVQDGRASRVPRKSVWYEPLAVAEDAMSRILASVGRVNLPGIGPPGYVGTAFMVAPGMAMTNRHVASRFADEKPAGRWIIRESLAPAIDFRAEHARPPAPQFPVTGIVLMHPRLDVALLHVEVGDSPGSLPPPLYSSDRAAAITPEKRVYAVGYPQEDAAIPTQILKRIFGDVFEVKRLAPGEVMAATGEDAIFSHDCSTLGGSSGSCIVDFNTHRVLGLHFGGGYEFENHAVSLPELRNDPHLSEVGVAYG